MCVCVCAGCVKTISRSLQPMVHTRTHTYTYTSTMTSPEPGLPSGPSLLTIYIYVARGQSRQKPHRTKVAPRQFSPPVASPLHCTLLLSIMECLCVHACDGRACNVCADEKCLYACPFCHLLGNWQDISRYTLTTHYDFNFAPTTFLWECVCGFSTTDSQDALTHTRKHLVSERIVVPRPHGCTHSSDPLDLERGCEQCIIGNVCALCPDVTVTRPLEHWATHVGMSDRELTRLVHRARTPRTRCNLCKRASRHHHHLTLPQCPIASCDGVTPGQHAHKFRCPRYLRVPACVCVCERKHAVTFS